MSIVFPSSLPGVSLFELSAAGQRASSPLPGYVNQRARTTSAWAEGRLGWDFTEAERAVFEAWFRDDLYRGSAWALIQLPITPDSGNPLAPCYTAVRFPRGYETQILADGFWRVEAEIEVRDRFECAIAPPLQTGFIGATEGAGTGSTVVPPPGVLPGDALVLAVVAQTTTFDGLGPAWSVIATGQDSSGGLRLNLRGRIADGTSADTATFTVGGRTEMHVMFAFRQVNDINFPALLTPINDYNVSLSGGGFCNAGAVLKTPNQNHFAAVFGFFESSGAGDLQLTGVPPGYTQMASQSMAFSISGTPFISQFRAGYKTYAGSSEDADAFPTTGTGVGGGGHGAALLVIGYTP